jgi:cell division septation protein DedD
MNQRPSVDNLKQFTRQTAQLNPQLQAVLGNLDVQLDDELARYRRKKRIEAEAPQSSGYRHRSTTPKNLEVVVTPGQRETPATRSREPFQLDRNGSEAIASDFMEANESNTFPSGLSPFSPQVNLPQKLEASLSSNRSNVSDPDAASSNITSINLAENNSPNSTESLDRPQDRTHDYLESSEQLLGSLDDSSASDLSTRLRNRRRQRRSLKNLLSPLSVGVTLLFVLITGTLAYMISGKMGDRQPVVTAENSASSTSSPTQTPLAEVPRSPNLADKEFVPLDLDTLGTLNRNSEINPPTIPEQLLPTVPITPAPDPTQTTPTTPAVPGQNYPSLENLNTAILPQSVQDNLPNVRANNSNNANSNNANSNTANSNTANSNNANSNTANSNNANSNNANSNNANSGNNSPQANTGASSPTPAATSQNPGTQTAQNLPQPNLSAQSFPAFFYVVIDYQNEDSLYLARQAIPDAYVREFPIGVKVQMAAFEDTASAQNMVQYLKEQGFAAQVYQP